MAYEKEFGLLARVLPHMLARWRLHADMEALARLPDGRIRFDVLAGTAVHASAGPVDLAIARELKAGLDSQLRRKGIAQDTLAEASVALDFDTSAVKTDRASIVHFDFRIAATLRAGEAVFTAGQQEDHIWHSREPDPA